MLNVCSMFLCRITHCPAINIVTINITVADSGMDSKYLASSMGISAKNIQGMKASFFGEGLQSFEGTRVSDFWIAI